MTGRTWLKLVRNSLLAAALITAAQIGIGSGVGVIDWSRGLIDPSVWHTLLTWVVFVFAVGVLGGAAVGQRFVPGRVAAQAAGASTGGGWTAPGTATGRGRLGGLSPQARFGLRATAAISAAVGAALAFPMIWLPVLVSDATVDLHPQRAIAVAAAIGTLAGVLACFAALAWGAVAAGSTLSATVVWLLALASAGLGVLDHARANPGLALLDAPRAIPASAWWFGPYFMVAVAVFVGLVVAAVAGWRGAEPAGIAVSGLVGPLLVALAYATTGWLLPAAGLTTAVGFGAPQVAALVAVAASLVVGVAVAAPQHRRPTVPAPTRAPLPVPLAPAAPHQPLAIGGGTADDYGVAPAEYVPAGYAPYVLEHGGTEAPYRREPAFYSDPVYLEPVSPPAAPAAPLRLPAHSADSYSTDPYSTQPLVVTPQTFAPQEYQPAPSASNRPAPPNSPAPVPSVPVPAPVPTPVLPPPTVAYPSTTTYGPPAGPVDAGPERRRSGRVFPEPVQAEPARLFDEPERPDPNRTAATYVEPSRLLAEGYARPATPAEPGFAERVYRAPDPAPAPTQRSKRSGRSASAPVPPPVPVPVPPPAAAPVPRPAAKPRSAPPPVPAPGPVAAPAPVQAAPVTAPRAAPAVADASPRRGRKAKAKATAAPAPAQRAAAIEGEIVGGSPAAGSAPPATPTSPATGTTPATPTGPGRPATTGRRGRKTDEKPLRKGERDHIDWISNLVSIPIDSELKTSKER